MNEPIKKNSSIAIATLILGILSPFSCGITSIPAIICGHISLMRIKRNQDLDGKVCTCAGLLIAYGILIPVLFHIVILSVLTSIIVYEPTKVEKEIELKFNVIEPIEVENIHGVEYKQEEETPCSKDFYFISRRVKGVPLKNIEEVDKIILVYSEFLEKHKANSEDPYFKMAEEALKSMKELKEMY